MPSESKTLKTTTAIKQVIEGFEPDVATAALKFALKPAAVSTVIAGIRNAEQAEKEMPIKSNVCHPVAVLLRPREVFCVPAH